VSLALSSSVFHARSVWETLAFANLSFLSVFSGIPSTSVFFVCCISRGNRPYRGRLVPPARVVVLGFSFSSGQREALPHISKSFCRGSYPDHPSPPASLGQLVLLLFDFQALYCYSPPLSRGLRVYPPAPRPGDSVTNPGRLLESHCPGPFSILSEFPPPV